MQSILCFYGQTCSLPSGAILAHLVTLFFNEKTQSPICRLRNYNNNSVGLWQLSHYHLSLKPGNIKPNCGKSQRGLNKFQSKDLLIQFYIRFCKECKCHILLFVILNSVHLCLKCQNQRESKMSGFPKTTHRFVPFNTIQTEYSTVKVNKLFT